MNINLAKQPFNVKLVLTLVALIAVGYLAILGKEILSPFIFACLFSILLLPLVRFLEFKCRFSRNLASITAVVIMIACIGLVFYFLGAQLSRLSADWPMFKEQLENSLTDLQAWISRTFHINSKAQLTLAKDAATKIVDPATVVAGATLLSVSSIMLFLVFTMIYTFFFLLYRGLIMKFIIRVFREENSSLVGEIIKQVQYIIRKYVVGLLIEMVIVAAFVAIVFTFMGVKYALLLGVITGLFNIIPYVGIFTAIIISALITFATAAGASQVLWVVLVLAGTHLVDSNVLLPIVVGSKVKINAMITVLGVVLGEMMWGIPGMFLSIPIIAVAKIIFDRIESLQPWGILLGEDDTNTKTLVAAVAGPEPSLEEDLRDSIIPPHKQEE
jgi:putative permease